MNASDLNSRTEKEGSGSDDGDGELPHGSSQDYVDIRDVIHPHGPPVNYEADIDDLVPLLLLLYLQEDEAGCRPWVSPLDAIHSSHPHFKAQKSTASRS
jgi:hypothetical protein